MSGAQDTLQCNEKQPRMPYELPVKIQYFLLVLKFVNQLLGLFCNYTHYCIEKLRSLRFELQLLFWPVIPTKYRLNYES